MLPTNTRGRGPLSRSTSDGFGRVDSRLGPCSAMFGCLRVSNTFWYVAERQAWAEKALKQYYCRCGEMADAQDLKSWGLKKPCRFESDHRHQASFGSNEASNILGTTCRIGTDLEENLCRITSS